MGTLIKSGFQGVHRAMPGPQEMMGHSDMCSVLVTLLNTHGRRESWPRRTRTDRRQDSIQLLGSGSGTTQLSFLPKRRVRSRWVPAQVTLWHHSELQMAGCSCADMVFTIHTSVQQTQAVWLKKMRSMTFPNWPQLGRRGCSPVTCSLLPLRPWGVNGCHLQHWTLIPKQPGHLGPYLTLRFLLCYDPDLQGGKSARPRATCGPQDSQGDGWARKSGTL